MPVSAWHNSSTKEATLVQIVKWAISWLISHATFKVFTSPTPEGNRLGGHDDPQLPNLYIIILVEVGPAIILHGYFQTS